MDINQLVHIDAKLSKNGRDVQIKMLADDTFLQLYEEDKQKAGEYLESLGRHTMFQPSFRLDEHCVTYSPHDPKIPKKYSTIVTAHIPYTLHVPNELVYNLTHPFPSCLYFKKQWTKVANGSSEVDVVTEKKTYIAGEAKIAGPVLPLDPTLAWEPRSTGINVERVMDTNGHFRYTIVTIEFDAKLDKTKDSLVLAREITAQALEVVNRALKIYQHATNAFHIQPLPHLVVTDIYFSESNEGLLPVVDTGIGNAVMNLAHKDIKKFHDLLESDFEPNITDLLFTNAQWAHYRKDYKLAVMESFIATDVCVENYLVTKCNTAKKTPTEIGKIMRGTTRIRFENAFKNFHQKQFSEHYQTEYANWEKQYLDVRNPVMHKGKIPSEQESGASIKENDVIIKVVRSLK
ncbi:MAG: hypothetical protein KAS04_02210 [Candidatus Aenigmarchaeota archaeon]|nr:hypothetical protein [Candidatus Aenigmarchaeota archaeon]